MDKLSLLGVVLALVAIVGGSVLKGSGIAGLMNPAAFVIVMVGTLAAIMLHTPMKTFKHGMKIMRWAFRPPHEHLQTFLQERVGL